MPKLPYFRNGANIINQLESAWINQFNGSFAAKKEPTFRGGQAKVLSWPLVVIGGSMLESNCERARG